MRSTNGAALIDLGVVSSDGEQKAPSRPVRRRLRPLLSALCAAAILASTTAAAPPLPPPPWQRLTIIPLPGSGSHFAFASDLLIVEDSPNGSVIAYELGGGRVRWRADPRLATFGAIAEGAGVIVVTGGRAGAAARNEPARTFGIDPATGSVRWERPGSLYSFSPFNLVNSVTSAGDRAILIEFGASEVLTAVDIRSGAELWRFDAGPEASVSFGWELDFNFYGLPRPGSYLVNRRDGHLAELSSASGVATELGKLPPGTAIVDVDADMIVAELGADPGGNPANGARPSVVVAYDRATLRELWRYDEPDSGGNRIRRCGSLLCRSGQRSMTAVEPRTGRPVWSADFQAYGMWSRPSGDLLVASGGLDVGNTLLDPATGATRAALGDWQALGQLGDALLVYMPNGNGTDQRTWIGRIAATGEPVVRPIGLFGPNGSAVTDCRLLDGWLACIGLNQALAVPLPSQP